MSDRTPAAEALEFARQRAAEGLSWFELNNTLFSVEGKCSELFPTPADRQAFTATPEYAALTELLEQRPW